jgi:hypothetical protein
MSSSILIISFQVPESAFQGKMEFMDVSVFLTIFTGKAVITIQDED